MIVMEDIGGESLADILKSGKLQLEEFLNLAPQIARIIANIHNRNIIHKDINPANIIWNRTKEIVRIIDFGIATELPREITSVKNPNVLEGTLLYISPEQTGRMNRCLDYRTDFYSLGVTYFRMLTGRLPFESEDLLKLVHSHIAIFPPSPHEIDEKIPKVVSDIILKLMAKNAEDRYQSASGLLADLKRCQRQFHESGIVAALDLGLEDVPIRFQIPQKLYGRERELETLLSAFERVSEGDTELMLVSGFSGVGKSVLIHELHRPIVKHRGYFVSGKFEKLKKDEPYSAIIQAFTGLARQILAEDEAKIGVWRERILSVLGPNGKIVTDIIPLFELVIGKQKDLEVLGPVESQNRFRFTFQEFLKVLAAKEHPLVIFLDDLQWADSASLHLLKLFTTDSDIKHLLIIGAYRDNETTSSHPLILTLDEIGKTGAKINNIFLQPLTREHAGQLLADTLNRPAPEMKFLAELLIRKTGGNPFFIYEFLNFLDHKGFFKFSPGDGWRWDLAEIEAMQVTDNVVALMVTKITSLPENSQEILKLGACLGSFFNLATLSTVSGKPEKDILPALNEIIKEGMLNRIDDMYRFSHDRVLEAAYSLIPDEEKVKQHYRIGSLELENTETESLKEKIFYIVNQLNAGVELVTGEKEKQRLAELNLAAGKKALMSNAYDSALNYFYAGIRLLGKNCWESSYDFTLALYQEAAAAAQLCADYSTMEKMAAEVFQHARTILDKIKTYETKIFACAAQNQLMEGVRIGLSVLRQLGLRLPEKPGKLRIVYELLSLKLLLMGKPVENMLQLPEMKDPYKLAIMQIISGVGTSAYYAAPDLLPLIVFYSIRLSMKYGNSIYSPYSYAGFGMILCGILGEIETGYRYGELALNLVEKMNIRDTKSRVGFVVWFLIKHWKRPIRETLKPLLDAYTVGTQTGELEFAALSASTHSINSFVAGNALSGVEKEIGKHVDTIRKFNQDTISTYQRIHHQNTLNLRGLSEDPSSLTGSAYDINKMLPVHKEANDISALFYMYYYLLYLNYLFEKPEEAFRIAELTKPIIDAVVSSPYVPLFYFYDSLTRMALYSREKKSVQKKLLKETTRNQKKMKKWAFHAPANYAHKFHLVEAEIARVRGDESRARKHYYLAIKLAHENEFLHEEALANELACNFYLALGDKKIAGVFIQDARLCYAAWGGQAKVRDIEKKYSSLLPAMSPAAGELDEKIKRDSTTIDTVSEKIDLASLMKASQAISGEIVLGNLLRTCLMIAMENSGAQRGFMLIDINGKLFIEASGDVESDIRVLESSPIEKMKDIAHSVVNYVARTQEEVILNYATDDPVYGSDPYIQNRGVKSILCAPIRHQARVTGIIYLENRVVADAFNSGRLQVLALLSSQMSISLENARLYKELKDSFDHQVTLNDSLQKALSDAQQLREALISREKMAAIGQMAGGIVHDLKNPIAIIKAYAEMVRDFDLTEENKKEYLTTIESESDRLSDMAHSILDFVKGEISLNREKVNLKAYVAEIANFIHPVFKEDNKILEWRVDHEGEISIDRDRMRRVIINLANNAREALPENGIFSIHCKINGLDNETGRKTGDRLLKMTFSDNGPGIPEIIKAKLFQPFATFGKQSGTGLGLAMVRQIVEAHGGTISCESEPGRGARFVVEMTTEG